MISRSERSVIHTVILMMSSGEPPAAVITRRTLSNISRHCSSRSAGTLPLSGSVPEIAPDATKGPRRLALGIGLTCLAPVTSMLRRFSIVHLSIMPTRQSARRILLGAVVPAHRVEPQCYRRTQPNRVPRVVVVGVVGQRMDKDVEALAVQHQPRHDGLELRRRKRKPKLRYRVRAPRRVAQVPNLDAKPRRDLFAQPRGARAGFGVVVDMRMIAVDRDRLSSCIGHCRFLPPKIFAALRGTCNIRERRRIGFFTSSPSATLAASLGSSRPRQRGLCQHAWLVAMAQTYPLPSPPRSRGGLGVGVWRDLWHWLPGSGLSGGRRAKVHLRPTPTAFMWKRSSCQRWSSVSRRSATRRNSCP